MIWDNITIVTMTAIYGVAIYNCYRILDERQSPSSSFAWIIIILLFPFLGIPLYFLVGKNRIRGFVKRRKVIQDKKHVRVVGADDISQNESPENYPKETLDEFSKLFCSFGSQYEATNGDVKLLIDGKSTFEEIFQAILNAKRYVLVQYYILRSDRLGIELKNLLVEKSKSGIPVYLLCDDFGSFWLSNDYISDLEKAGAKVVRFLPIANFKRFFQLNFRNHRKLVITDGEFAFTGGLNVGEEYVSSYFKTKRTKEDYWRDTHLKIEGAIVAKAEEAFLDDWFFATGRSLELPKIDAFIGQPHHNVAMQVIPTGPTDQSMLSVLLLLQIIRSAKERLWLATPYFVPDTTLLRALEHAVLRGVDVRLIIPEKSDSHVIRWVAHDFAEAVSDFGVKVFKYQPGFMHQKTILVDDNLAGIGTMNLDNRAIYLNFEMTILVHDTRFAKEVEQMLIEDFFNTEPFDPKTFKISFIKKLRSSGARLLSPLL